MDSGFSSPITSPRGITRANGLPRLVTSTGFPVEFTSAITARHFALNSPAAIVFITPPRLF
jgi:hypothetical protein